MEGAIWDRVFAERSEWGRYPSEDLVRFIARHYYSAADRTMIKILDLGCGPGAGASWFVAREGFSLVGIDGSTVAIDRARQRFSDEGLSGQFHVGDIVELPFGDDSFDCVIDIVCLQCNDEQETKEIIGQIWRVLKPGGRHFSITGASGTWGDGTGSRVDRTTFTDIPDGPFARLGVNRFATKQSILDLYSCFNEITLNYSVRSIEGGPRELHDWLVSCKK